MFSVSHISVPHNITIQENYKRRSTKKRVASPDISTQESDDTLLKMKNEHNCAKRARHSIQESNMIKAHHVWKKKEVDLLVYLASMKKYNKKYTWGKIAADMNFILKIEDLSCRACTVKYRRLPTEMKSRISLEPQLLSSLEKISHLLPSRTLETIQSKPKTKKYIKWKKDELEKLVKLKEKTALTFSEISNKHFTQSVRGCQNAYQRYKKKTNAAKEKINESKQRSVPNAQIQQNSASLIPEQPLDTSTLIEQIRMPREFREVTVGTQTDDFDVSTFFNPKSHLLS